MKLLIHLFGGTKLLTTSEVRDQLVAALSHCYYWNDEEKRWVGDMAVLDVEELDTVN